MDLYKSISNVNNADRSSERSRSIQGDEFEGTTSSINKNTQLGFGGKTIGMFAGISLLVNNITGPGIPQLPNMFSEAGWLVPTIILLAVWVMTSLSTAMYCEAMRKIPGNEHFRDRLEYTSIVKYYFGRKGFIAAQVGLVGALQAINIVSIIQSAQVMDNAISAIFHHSCGINISPFANTIDNTTLDGSMTVFSCIDTNDTDNGTPWGCHVVISLGFLVALVITIPMGYFNLDDNMIVQEISFVAVLLCWLVWLVAFFMSDTFTTNEWSVPAVNEGKPWASQSAVLGTILFNFGYVTTVPSWVNEKKPNVSINKTVWISTFICTCIYLLMGIPGAMAFQSFLQGPSTGQCSSNPLCTDCVDNVMDALTSNCAPSAFQNNKGAHFILQASVYLFPIMAVLSSIPVFSIVIKYNLMEQGFSKRFAFFWGVIVPWIVALPLLYQPDSLSQFINFSSLVFVSFTDFIVPWCLYMALQLKQMKGEIYDQDESGVQLMEPAIKIHEHFALPESWRLSCKTKLYMSGTLVVCMTAGAIAGIILQIQTTANATWSCAGGGS